MDPTMLALALAVSAYCAVAVTAMITAAAVRGHSIGQPIKGVWIGSGISSLGLPAVAVEMSSTVLPMVAIGTLGAGLVGAGLGLVLSDMARTLSPGTR